ncbi:unnamed protein product [Zymoseptoria tritici ST99CH_3D1]|nr:unnamed protein product [Zymoseptoria tritici ST99CH_3D1]
MAALFRRSPTICQCQRAFSTSTPRAVSLQWDKNDPEALAEVLPPYPYGPTRWYKQSRLGLYGGQRIQFGNNVGEKFKTKSRRTWHPNIFTRKLFSKSLNRVVQVRVSSRVLRTIDKLGGLDEYLLGEKEARIKELGESGWWLRWAIMQTPTIQRRFRGERTRLGLAANPEQNEVIEEAFQNLAIAEKTTEQLLEETEPIAMDGAFTVEQPANLPVIKFRVAPGKHVMLTPNGWRRTRPSPDHWQKPIKEKIAAEITGPVARKVQQYAKILDKEQSQPDAVQLTEYSRARLISLAKQQYKAELAPKIEARFSKHLSLLRRKKALSTKRKVLRKRKLTGRSQEKTEQRMNRKGQELAKSVKLVAPAKI